MTEIHSCSYYCDRPECAAQTPLVDLLSGVPEDATANYEESALCSHHIPYGRLCREALSEIKKLTAERDELRKPTRYALDSDGLCFVEGLGWVVRCCDAAGYVARMLAQVAELKREQGEG